MDAYLRESGIQPHKGPKPRKKIAELCVQRIACRAAALWECKRIPGLVLGSPDFKTDTQMSDIEAASLILADHRKIVKKTPLRATFQFDPNVWSGRASQEVFVEVADVRSCINVSGLRLELVALRAIMDISARAISLADRPQGAIRVTSVRMRRKDRSSISSHPLADLGR